MMLILHSFHQIGLSPHGVLRAVHRRNLFTVNNLRSFITGDVHERFVRICPTFFVGGLAPVQ
jgi:hypothetical protein